MARIKNPKLAGGAFLIGSLILFGKETVAWAWSRVLDSVSSGAASVTITAIPWQNLIASLMGITGMALMFWPSNKPPKRTRKQVAQGLGIAGLNIAARLGLHQGAFSRAMEQRDPLHGIINDGISLIISMSKQGFVGPDLTGLQDNHQAALAMLEYFSRLSPLLRDGHVDEATAAAPKIAEQSVSNALTLRE